MHPKPCLVVLALSAVLGVAATQASPQYFTHAVSPNAKPLPFSDAVLAGETLYVAGHLGLDPKTGQAPADTGAEAVLVMDSVQSTLKAAGLSMDDLVSVTVYCTDLSLYDSFNRTYVGYFHGQLPARAMIGVASLLRGGHFEVQGIAVRPAARPH
ncbi:MAG TPA: Rid family hydrolase [Steroidobacteraceae bacterium]